MNDSDMTVQEKWYATLLRRALKHTPDPEEALAAVDIALSIQPFPDETIVDQPEEPEEEDILVDAAFAFDLFDKRAQGILNRAMTGIKKMTAEARRAFQQALDKPTVQEATQAIFDFIYKYRVQVARLLGTTQLAAVLEGAREVARHLPALPLAELGGVPPPPSLSPIEAAQLVDRLRSLPLLEQQAAIYNLPPQQQGFARAALGTKGPPSSTEGITTFRPAFVPSEGPERVHFLLIDEAARELSEKNLVTRQVFDRLDAATRQKAFTIAGVSAEETLGKVRDVMVENLTKGVDFESFKKEVLGGVDEGTFLSEAHMETVFRANVSGAFSDGKREVLAHPFVRSGFPYVSYEAIHDDRVRQDHLYLEKHGIDGTNVFRIDDPVFESFRPPWDYNCRCSWVPLTVQHAAELGLKEAKQWLSTGEEPTPPARVAWPAFRPPVGFQRPIDSVALSIQLSMLSLSNKGEPEQVSFFEIAADEANTSGVGNTASSQPGDHAPDPPAKGMRSARRKGSRRGRAQKRRYVRESKKSRAWKPAALPAILSIEDPGMSFAMEESYGTESPSADWIYAGEMKWVRPVPVKKSRKKPTPKRGGPKIAVVGGGPGGLFATYIINQRIPNAVVTIFESTDLLGGKMFTDEFSNGTPFEAGVSELYEYLGGDDDDPMRKLIEEDLALPTVDMAGGGVILRGKILRDLDDVEKEFSYETRKRIERFHNRMTELMPLEKYAHRWQPDNDHPWANKTFRECIREEIPDDDIACQYIEVAVHSDLATEPHTCNGLNGIKNVLMDNHDYMKLYHVIGGIERISEALEEKIQANVRFETRVVRIAKDDEGYDVFFRENGEEEQESFDSVMIALPNHWLTQLEWGDARLSEAIHRVLAHYDLPAHYFRISLLFENNWWEKYKIPGDYWMMDMFNGCCAYNESHRWRSTHGHVLTFLLGGADALLQCSGNEDDSTIISRLIDSLPEFMREDAWDEVVEAQIDRYAGSINAQPGGWPAEELRAEHVPEPKEHPGIFLVGDYFFDSTLNAALISANTAVEQLLDYLEIKGAKASPALQELESTGPEL